MSSDLIPPKLIEFSEKPKILYIADVPNWSFDIKGKQYKRYLPQYDIDIGYSTSELPTEFTGLHWKSMIKTKHYDVVWFLHDNYISDLKELIDFVFFMNQKNTQVILTQNNVLSYEHICSDIKRYAAFNFLSANNPWCYENFKKAGFQVYKTYDGVDLNIFGPDKHFYKRDFKVLFVSSKLALEHKGYYIWKDVKQRLKDQNDIEFVEIIADSTKNTRTPEEMNKIYNECQVYVCLSYSEGGPCTLLESTACGCVPIMTKTGYCNYFKNIFVIERSADACCEKILYLKNNFEEMQKMSRALNKEILPWHDKLMSQHWGYFLQKAVIKAKGLSLV